MKRSVTFPMHTSSENTKRPLNAHAAFGVATRTKRERSEMALYLASLPKPPGYMPGTSPPAANRIEITLTRISPGELDDDNLRGALKAVRDGIADWLGIKDHDRRLAWVYMQQSCPLRQFGVRVEIEDETEGEEVRRIIGNVPTRMSTASERGAARRDVPKATTPAKRAQRRLFSRPCFALLPWDDEGVASRLAIDGDPPEVVRIAAPARALGGSRFRAGEVVVLRRSAFEDEDLGAVWLYQHEETRNHG